MPATLDDYEVLHTIGSGSYGTCKKIRRKRDGKILVWKEMEYGQMTEVEKQLLVSEVNLLRELKHQNIVRYYDRIIDRANSTLYLVMEHCEGGDLGTVIARNKREGTHVEEEFVWRICTQVISALKLCHSRSQNGKTVLHRDLKPANVFLDTNKSVKLGDFGLARVLHHDTSFAKTFVGTPYYMSPEQMTYMSYNEKSDIWSLGCLLYELCSLRPPFTASNQTELASKICVGKFSRIPLRYTEELQELITLMLQVDGKKRPSVLQLADHPSVAKRMSGSQRSSSCTSLGSVEEGSSSLRRREEALRAREEAVAAKEQEMAQREKQLQDQLKNLQIKEKTVEEKMTRVDKLMKEYNLLKSKAAEMVEARAADILDTSQTSILAKGKSAVSPKKQVSFHVHEKENGTTSRTSITDSVPKLDENRDIYSNLGYNRYSRRSSGGLTPTHDYDITDMLRKAKDRSDDLRRMEWESKLRTRTLFAMR